MSRVNLCFKKNDNTYKVSREIARAHTMGKQHSRGVRVKFKHATSVCIHWNAFATPFVMVRSKKNVPSIKIPRADLLPKGILKHGLLTRNAQRHLANRYF